MQEVFRGRREEGDSAKFPEILEFFEEKLFSLEEKGLKRMYICQILNHVFQGSRILNLKEHDHFHFYDCLNIRLG